jgi:hypothetical protein
LDRHGEPMRHGLTLRSNEGVIAALKKEPAELS